VFSFLLSPGWGLFDPITATGLAVSPLEKSLVGTRRGVLSGRPSAAVNRLTVRTQPPLTNGNDWDQGNRTIFGVVPTSRTSARTLWLCRPDAHAASRGASAFSLHSLV